MRSMPRNAWVIQITPVRLTRTTANDANVVRNIYLSIDPIVYRTVPTRDQTRGSQLTRIRVPKSCAACVLPVQSLTTIPLIRQQNGRGMAPVILWLINHPLWRGGHATLGSAAANRP